MVESRSKRTAFFAVLVTMLLALLMVPSLAFAQGGGESTLRTQGLMVQDEPIDISGATVKKLDATYAYTGEAIALKPSVSMGDTKLVQGTDYDVLVKQDGAEVELKELGTYDVTVVGKGAYAGTIARTVRVVPYFTVYLQRGDGEPEAVKSFASYDELAALKSESADPVSGLYWKSPAAGGDAVWQVCTAATYVTLDDLLDAAGIAESWAPGSSISYDAGEFTYDQVQARSWFYPAAQQGSSSTDKQAVAAPFVLSLTEFSGETGADADAEAVQAANVAAANAANAPRVVFGIDEAGYLNPSDKVAGASAAGKRLWSGTTSITIKQPARTDASDAQVALDKASYTYTGKAIEPAVTVKLGDATLVNGTDYTVAYDSNTNVGTAKVTVTFIGAYKGSAEATFNITGAAPTITAANKSVAMGKTVSIGAKVNSGGKLTYKSSNAKVAKVDANGKVTPVAAGSATITVSAAAKGNYAAGSKTVTVKVTKGANTMTAKGKAISIKAGKFVLAAKAFTVKNAKGKVTYKKASGNAKITVASNGKITVKKGLAKKTYTVKVNVTAAGDKNWNAKTVKNVAVKVTVK